MSYTIEYDRVVLKSEEGLTPCWLSGDNNVTTGSGKHERRVRSWSTFLNLVGVTEAELKARVEKFIGSSDEKGQVWYRQGQGKWMTYGGVRRWMDQGIRNACSLDDLLSANNRYTFHAYLHVWRNNKTDNFGTSELSTYLGNTEDLDRWIRAVRAYMMDALAEGWSCYPIIALNYDEPVKKPMSEKQRKKLEDDEDAMVLIKQGRTYLVEWSNGNSVSWTYDPLKATPIKLKEAQDLLDSCSSYRCLFKNAKIVSTSALESPWNACIQISVKDSLSPSYIYKLTPKRLQMTSSLQYAKHYKDKASAEATIKRIAGKYPKVERFEVVIDESKKK